MLLGVGGAVGAQPASAALAQCPANNACGWAHKDYAGGYAPFFFDTQNFTYFTMAGCANNTLNDCISSAWNHKDTCNATFYLDINYLGFPFTTFVPDRKKALVVQNDQWSSVRIDAC